MPVSEKSQPTRRRFTDDSLLDAARDVFVQRGFASAQVIEIAERAGTTKPTLYARVGDKEEIYLRVLQREADLLESRLRTAYAESASLSLHELVVAAVAPVFRFVAERRDGVILLLRADGGRPENPVIQRLTSGIREPIAELIAAGFPVAGAQPSLPSTAALATVTVGIVLDVARLAIDEDRDLDAAAALTVNLIESVYRGLDLDLVARFDHGS